LYGKKRARLRSAFCGYYRGFLCFLIIPIGCALPHG
jgi:hypothetical protein